MYKVLIAEDEHVVRLGLRNIIQWEKFDMAVTSDVVNGQEAWEAYVKHSPDVLLTDLRMPVMDGISLIRKIRQSDKRIRIVILTCLHEFEMVREALALGVSSYLLKVTTEPSQIEHVMGKILDELHMFGRTSLNNKYLDPDLFKEQIMDDFIFYQSIPAEVFADYIRFFEMRLTEKGLIVSIIRLLNYEKIIWENGSGHDRKLRSLVLGNINKKLNKHNIGEVYMESVSSYILIFSMGETEQHQAAERVRNIIMDLKNDLWKEYEIGIQYGISSLRNGFSILPELREEAIANLENWANQANPKIEVIKIYLTEHYSEDISLQVAADYVGLTKNYLSHLFTRHIGVPFTTFLNNIRINQAKKMLESSNYSVREIGNQVGYWDATYFIRVFKKINGCTPEEYRTRMKLCE